ncbi:MAG: hypothetical protein JWM02_2406 [Frankiales bacterium]|nr:hypothetical protein [Frankiales bacterium]
MNRKVLGILTTVLAMLALLAMPANAQPARSLRITGLSAAVGSGLINLTGTLHCKVPAGDPILNPNYVVTLVDARAFQPGVSTEQGVNNSKGVFRCADGAFSVLIFPPDYTPRFVAGKKTEIKLLILACPPDQQFPTANCLSLQLDQTLRTTAFVPA